MPEIPVLVIFVHARNAGTHARRVAKQMPAETTIESKTEGPLVIITFVPPEGGVATLKKTTYEKLEKAIRSNRQGRVFIITGGGKGFLAGADIREMETLRPSDAKAFALTGQRVLRLLELIPQPVIAAINGYALGGGCELALACDLRIASTNATLGQPELSLGIPPGGAGTQRLPRLIGLSQAKKMILTGEALKAEVALAIGLVHAVVEPARLMETARRVAKRLLQKSPNAIALTKRAFVVGEGKSFQEGSLAEAQCFREAFEHPDRKEGMKAFLEKRAPQFF